MAQPVPTTTSMRAGQPAGATEDLVELADLAFSGPSPATRTNGTAGATRRQRRLDALAFDLSEPAQREFGDYELIERVGEGGMGVVFHARQKSLDRDVAIKLLAAGPWASRDIVERLIAEARHAAQMQHPNLVTVYEVGTAEGLPFFSMQLVAGQSLDKAIADSGPIEPRRAAALVQTIAEAVAYAHSLGLLHLDLKPANVLLDSADEPHVTDFGVARKFDPLRGTGNSEISGTPDYMAPEQAEIGMHPLTPATDVWGLGAILYELVTGVPPFHGSDTAQTLASLRTGELRRPRSLRRHLSRDLDAIIARCLAKRPEDRYASARELADELGRYIEGHPVHARPLDAAQRIGRWIRREPRITIAAALVTLLLVGGLATSASQWRRAEHNAARGEAVREFLTGVFAQADPDHNHGQPLDARQLLDRGTAAIERDRRADPALRADLTGLLGGLYWGIGDYPRADALLAQALASSSVPLVPADVRARILLTMARTEVERNRFNDAIDHARSALDLLEASGAAASLDASAARRLVADSLTGRGDARHAEPLLREALARDRRQFREPSEPVIQDLQSLSDALKEQGRFEEAARVADEEITHATELHGRNHSSVINGLQMLASARCSQGRCVEAERALREAVAIATRLYGPTHRETVVQRSNLLWTLERQGRWQEALQGRLELRTLEQSMQGTRPEQMAYAVQYLAGDYNALGRFDEAEQSARAALAQWVRVHGADDTWDSTEALHNLAQALQFRGELAAAEMAYRKEIAILGKHESPSSPWLNRALADLGNLMRWQQRYADALMQTRAAAAKLAATRNPVHAGVLAALAEAELDSGDAAAARETARTGVAMAREVLPAGHPDLGAPLYALARVAITRGDAASAEPLLREALALRGAAQAAADPRVLEVKVALARVFTMQGRKNESHAMRLEVEPWLRASGNPYLALLRARLTAAPAAPKAGTGGHRPAASADA
ncbi:MAG: serine/threonine-protein kinase [Lysobacterales bacterium]